MSNTPRKITISAIPTKNTPETEGTSQPDGTNPDSFGPPPQAVLHNRLVDVARGTHRVVVYACGSRGLANFVRPLCLTAYKLGVTSANDAQRRIVDLRRKHYGALFGRVGQPIEELETIEQADEWALVPFHVDHAGENPELPPGFHLRAGVLEIEVRLDVPVEAVDQALHAMMAERALDAFLASQTGRGRLSAIGRDPEGMLLTPYTLMFEEVRISRVKEIYLWRPQVEFPRFVASLARVLAPMMPAGQGKVGEAA